MYVGKSTNVSRRVRMHMSGLGAKFTSHLFRPTGRQLPRLGILCGPGDGPERDETLRQMELRGPEYVRGWKFCNQNLTLEDRVEIEANLRELFDLCRRCGRPDHFARSCKHSTDRHGKAIPTTHQPLAVEESPKNKNVILASKPANEAL